MKALSILVEKMSDEARMSVGLHFARLFGKPHFQFTASKTLLSIGFKEDLKSLRKTEIFSALDYDASDPETWGAQWIPTSDRWGRRKDLRMWSDEYEAQKKGIPFRKEVEDA